MHDASRQRWHAPYQRQTPRRWQSPTVHLRNRIATDGVLAGRVARALQTYITGAPDEWQSRPYDFDGFFRAVAFLIGVPYSSDFEAAAMAASHASGRYRTVALKLIDDLAPDGHPDYHELQAELTADAVRNERRYREEEP